MRTSLPRPVHPGAASRPQAVTDATTIAAASHPRTGLEENNLHAFEGTIPPTCDFHDVQVVFFESRIPKPVYCMTQTSGNGRKAP
jgi:hypothetical protein